MTETARKKDIAIIGLSCNFPKSKNKDIFWKNLIEGKEMIHFFSKDELGKIKSIQYPSKSSNMVYAKSFIDNLGQFDYPFFGYTRDEANCMDPQIRFLHEQVWSALEDAACDVSSSNEKIGLYLSASDNFYWVAHAMIKTSNKVNPYYASQLSNKRFISTLISYNLDLKGPSYIIDTACSSSLASVHIACRSLLLRECSLALAGGVSLDVSKNIGYKYQEDMIYSKDGHCKVFDKTATGTIRGDGAGMVVLKRFEDAIRDRDHVYAVIRSSAVNNDGKEKVGYTAPSINGQSSCINLAHRVANVAPESISYVEAHGTGTNLGDPIEVEALNQAFNNNTAHKCAIGSVKSNIGHLDSAAGVAGLIKTVLAIQNKVLPPSINFNKANPDINFESGPFYVNSKLKDWERQNGAPLRAGVSSFGIGGTNVHVVLEESTEILRGSTPRPYQMLLYSAKTRSSLLQYETKLHQFLADNKKIDLADLAYTLKLGRKEFQFRNYITCRNKDEALKELKKETNNDSRPFLSNPKRGVVFMFPGQGSQHFEMAKDLYLNEPHFKSVMDKGFDFLFAKTGKDYSEIIGYANAGNNDKDLINNTLYTQPLLFLVEYAVADLLLNWGVRPKYIIGHSLGEYVAACISGIFSFEEGLNIILKRAHLMYATEKGEMIVANCPVDIALPILGNGLSIAAINSINSCVISGSKKNMDKFCKTLSAKDIQFKKLKTSHAFHSEMMDSILDAYEEELRKVKFGAPNFSIISNLTGEEALLEDMISPKYWVRHLRETVNFSSGIEMLLKQEDLIFIELGPGTTLSTFCKQSLQNIDKDLVLTAMRRPLEEVNDAQKLSQAISKLWCSGIEIDWKAYYEGDLRNKISAPSYAFDEHLLDAHVNPFEHLIEDGYLPNNSKRKPSDWFYVPNWRKSFGQTKENVAESNGNYLIFTDNGALISSISNRLISNGNCVVEVKRDSGFRNFGNNSYSIQPDNEEDFGMLFKDFDKEQFAFDHIIFNWNFKGYSRAKFVSAFLSQLYLCKKLANYQPNSKKKITLLSNLGNEVVGKERANIPMMASSIIYKIFAQEHPNIFHNTIDINQSTSDPETVSGIIGELKDNSNIGESAYRNGTRWIKFYENIDLSAMPKIVYLKKNMVVLITGGLGSVGNILTTYLCDNYKAKIIIIGRTELKMQGGDKNYSNDDRNDLSIRTKLERLQNHHRKGRKVFYHTVNVVDKKALESLVQNIERDHGKISGVIQTAGNVQGNSFKSLENTDLEVIGQQFEPKVDGILNLYSIFKKRELDFLWIVSSLSSILGGLTYSAYATANKFMDAFFNNKKDELKNWFCVNLDGIGKNGIDENDLIEVFEKSFKMKGESQLVVSRHDPNILSELPKASEATIAPPLTETLINRPTQSIGFKESTTSTEKKLCEIWRSFFNYDKIGVKDNFFELGGDSLRAMTLIKMMEKSFDLEINLQDFYSKPTIKELSREIDLAVKLLDLQESDSGKNVIKI